ncbi:MAG: pyridoxamine 5'-phosphate oxidase [Ornithinimicrobium sp.]|uniref:pyridoxamine 5'-phosphate oxidase n=1 Tax=Ornithinimicrobium sp. TaxID=1977084 RepID=UPI0026DF6DFE|nr:pyridoxamine 5'-phosphate oxidase [Ornithinimicrobium sp.]MDO5739254.1 pyridoxamine 5'-phosphate oxidase [Ornithinimicrobium sp.]
MSMEESRVIRDDGLELGEVRVDYRSDGLVEGDCPQAPLAIVLDWVEAAVARQAERGDVPEPTSMEVATVDVDGLPDVRTVLMRGIDAQGPQFFTNTDSSKGRQLRANPMVASVLTWPAMFRAIRFRGRAELLTQDEVTTYFRTRPWGSRVGAHASDQSRPAPDRAAIETAYRKWAERYPDTGEPGAVPVPAHWGGYRIVPDRVELWAGRRSRLHDRIVWERIRPGGLEDAGAWRRSRLQP